MSAVQVVKISLKRRNRRPLPGVWAYQRSPFCPRVPDDAASTTLSRDFNEIDRQASQRRHRPGLLDLRLCAGRLDVYFQRLRHAGHSAFHRRPSRLHARHPDRRRRRRQSLHLGPPGFAHRRSGQCQLHRQVHRRAAGDQRIRRTRRLRAQGDPGTREVPVRPAIRRPPGPHHCAAVHALRVPARGLCHPMGAPAIRGLQLPAADGRRGRRVHHQRRRKRGQRAGLLRSHQLQESRCVRHAWPGTGPGIGCVDLSRSLYRGHHRFRYTVAAAPVFGLPAHQPGTGRSPDHLRRGRQLRQRGLCLRPGEVVPAQRSDPGRLLALAQRQDHLRLRQRGRSLRHADPIDHLRQRRSQGPGNPPAH